MRPLDLQTHLAVIEQGLQRLGRGVLLKMLQGGLPSPVVKTALHEVGLTGARELHELYGWHNGTSTAGVNLDDIQLFPGFYLLSIEDSIANYRAFLADARWTAGWLPLLANGGGDFYLIDLRLRGVAPVRHFRIEESEHPVEFSSLDALFQTLAKAYQEEMFFVDAQGYLEMNDATFAKLAARLNPDVSWWR